MKRVLFTLLALGLGLAAPSQAQEMQECLLVDEPRSVMESAVAIKTTFGPDDPIVQSVVIGYDTDLAVQAAASGVTVADLIAEAFRWGNEATRLSGMRTRARVVGLQEFPYTGPNWTWASILPWWRNEGANFKASRGAQLALYVTSDSIMGGGGSYFYTGSPLQTYSVAALTAEDLDPDTPRSAFNGKTAFHEILGHTHGARHSVPTDQPGAGCYIPEDNTCRGYAWYAEDIGEYGVRDVMANWPPNSKFIQRFSNPEKTYQGLVTGEVGFMEAAQVIDENAERVFNFTTPAGASICLDDGAGLCLLDRFYITVTWETADGSQGWGVPVQLTDNPATGKGGGYWWFFNQDNPEVFIKILNACSFSPYYWVFATGLTDVEVHVRVEDTAHFGEVWPLDSVLGTPFPPTRDTTAFATCP